MSLFCTDEVTCIIVNAHHVAVECRTWTDPDRCMLMYVLRGGVFFRPIIATRKLYMNKNPGLKRINKLHTPSSAQSGPGGRMQQA